MYDVLTFIILILLILFSVCCFEGRVHVFWHPQGLQLEKLDFSSYTVQTPNDLEHNFES